MNICFITKYPPIQGGVSMHCYWAARGLAERGHSVFVVTNADEVEETFRIEISEADRSDQGMYAPFFSETGGRVEVHSTKPPDRSELYYIPLGNPTVSRLAARATDIIREHKCEVIFSYYLEPYGMAAHLASYWTHVPYVFKHAGSDLYRLMPISELTTAYREVLTQANRVLSGGPSRRVVTSHGVPEERIESSIGFNLPRDFFNGEREPLDLELDSNLPVLGIYGKMGEWKGTFDLIHAIKRLVDDGFPLQLVALSHGWQETRFHKLSQELGVDRYLRVKPFIPHWQIPAFIKACTAVAFLEREFPIVAHTPTIPSEILSCGGCLIVSEEVLRKQLFRWKTRDRQNLIVVSDPKDHGELAEAIRFALTDPKRAEEIGRRGLELVDDASGYPTYINALEKVLTQVSGESPVGPKREGVTSGGLFEERRDPLDMIKRTYPYVHALLDDDEQHRLRLAFQGSGVGAGVEDHASLALLLGQWIHDELANDSQPRLIADVCRYEYKMHQWSKFFEKNSSEESRQWGSFPRDPNGLVPVIHGAWEVQEFTFDVERVAECISSGETVGKNGELNFANPAPVFILFHEGSMPMRIGPSTAALLALLEKERLTISELLPRLQNLLGSESTESLKPDVLSTLEGLYWEKALRFELAT